MSSTEETVAERRKKLLDKVSKLLAQAQGTPYPQEAQSAYTMAQRLMLENGLTLAEVDALSRAEQEALVAHEDVDTPSTHYLEWCLELGDLIAENFRCKATWRMRTRRCDGARVPTTLRFLGVIDDVVVARDVYRSASTEAPRLAKEYSHANVESRLMEDHGLQPLPPYPSGRPRHHHFSAEERRALHRALQASFLDGFLEGLRQQYREQLAADPSLALLLTIHPRVQERYDRVQPFDYEPSGEAAGLDEAAEAAGAEAGRRFRPERTRELGAGTPQLPGGES